MLTQKNISAAIKNFVVAYNKQQYKKACNFYADHGVVIGDESPAVGRAEILRQLRKDAHIDGCDSIELGQTIMRIESTKNTAVVWQEFSAAGEKGVSVLMIKLIDGRPQVVGDMTMV